MIKTQNHPQQYILNALKDAEREGRAYLSEESLYRACVRTCPGDLGWNAFLADCVASCLNTTLDPLVAGNLLKDKTAFFRRCRQLWRNVHSGSVSSSARSPEL